MCSSIMNPRAKCTPREGPGLPGQRGVIERASYRPGAGREGRQRRSVGISGGEGQGRGRGSDWIFPKSNTDQNKALFKPDL